MNAIQRVTGHRIFVGMLSIGAIVSLTGCSSLVGRWTGDELNPEMARDQFKLLRPEGESRKLVSADLRLQQDGSYTAELMYDGYVEHSLGTWKMERPDYLSFVDNEGKSYGYSVRRSDDNSIALAKSIKGTDATLRLTKKAL